MFLGIPSHVSPASRIPPFAASMAVRYALSRVSHSEVGRCTRPVDISAFLHARTYWKTYLGIQPIPRRILRFRLEQVWIHCSPVDAARSNPDSEKPSLSFGRFAETRASGAKPNRVVLVFRRGASTAIILLLLLLHDCQPPPLLTSRTSLPLFPSPLYPSDELKSALHAPPSCSRSPVVSTCGPQKPVKSVFSASNILCRETTLHSLWGP